MEQQIASIGQMVKKEELQQNVHTQKKFLKAAIRLYMLI